MMSKHIVCFSKGHSSALVAIEVTRKFGKENVILLNHDIHPDKEEADIKRFGSEVSEYLGIPITYCNINGIENPLDIPDQFDIAIQKQGFKAPGTGDAFCTSELKTIPFNDFIKKYFPDADCIIYYGFDANEMVRVARRQYVLGSMGYQTDYPLAFWGAERETENGIEIYNPRTIFSTEEIGIRKPNTYSQFKHANCTGCLKGGMQHWYVTYCTRYDIFKKAKETEEYLGYSILRMMKKGVMHPSPLSELEPIFERMKCAGVPASEHIPRGEFGKYLKKYKIESLDEAKPCECFV